MLRRIFGLLGMIACLAGLPMRARAEVTPLLGCTLTTTGTACARGLPSATPTLPRIGDGVRVTTTIDQSPIGYVRNSGTFTATLECQLRPADPFLPIAGSTCTDSCIVPSLPQCNNVRVNVTACASCNVSVYVLKEQ